MEGLPDRDQTLRAFAGRLAVLVHFLIMIKYLYKYYPLNDYTKRIFTHNEVYFPSPLKFNDPFDFNIPISL